MTAVLAFNPRKAEMQISALQVSIDHLGDNGPPKSIALCVAILPVYLQLLKVVLHTAIITACLRISRSVNVDVVLLGAKLSIVADH